ncbi:MAG: alkaline phosphatase D family protein [Deltaproteobacteria bacterium]|nr:alkaline phosphatase D family protein [Deltaproteobacteria bacterium]
MSDELPGAGAPPSDAPPSAGTDDSTTRRGFIKTTAAVAAAAAIGCTIDGPTVLPADSGTGSDSGSPLDSDTPDSAVDGGDGGPDPVEPPESTPENTDDFELGVSSGDVSHEDAIIWTRYSGALGSLTMALWEMDGDEYLRVVTEGETAPASGGFVHVAVTGLVGGRRYRYAFFEVGAGERLTRSPIGRFRAALAPGQRENLIIGACSCTENGRSFDTLVRAGERDDLDVFLLLGDTTYNDDAITREDFRAHWAENLGAPGYLELRQKTSVLVTWDDHEVEDNFNAESADIEMAREAFFENLPLRRDLSEPERLWKSIRWGDTAEVFVLDCRGERRQTTLGTTDIYISPAQMEWLKAGLAASSAVFKIIVNSVPIAEYPVLFDSALDDRWEGYTLQREETGMLWVSGDFHFASAQRVSRPGNAGATQIEILAGPGAHDGNPAAFALRSDPQFDFTTDINNYVTMELIPATNTIRISWIDRAGTVIEVLEYVV